MEINFYRADDGTEPAADYIRSLSDKQRQKVVWTLETIRGLEGRIPKTYFKKLQGTADIWEIRVIFSGNIFRLLSFFDGGKLVVVAHAIYEENTENPNQRNRDRRKKKARLLQGIEP